MAEVAISSYARSFSSSFRNVCSARAGNVIGGGDFAPDRIVPDVIKSIINQSTLSVRSPSSIRPWQHVLEPLSGYLTILSAFYNHSLVNYEAFNFAPTSLQYKTVKELLDELQVHLPELSWTDTSSTYTGPRECGILKLNSDKASQLLNWTPRLNFKETVEFTSTWYKSFLSASSISDITESQVRYFFDQ